ARVRLHPPEKPIGGDGPILSDEVRPIALGAIDGLAERLSIVRVDELEERAPARRHFFRLQSEPGDAGPCDDIGSQLQFPHAYACRRQRKPHTPGLVRPLATAEAIDEERWNDQQKEYEDLADLA